MPTPPSASYRALAVRNRDRAGVEAARYGHKLAWTYDEDPSGVPGWSGTCTRCSTPGSSYADSPGLAPSLGRRCRPSRKRRRFSWLRSRSRA